MLSKKWYMGISLLLLISLTACASNSESTGSKKSSEEPIKVTNSSSDSQKTEDSLPKIMNKLAANGQSVDEIYVTGDITVGNDATVKPGIYDLEVTGGLGNFTGTRKDINGLFFNWVLGTPDSGADYASKVRLILFDGDVLSFRNISKIKLNAVPEKVTEATELGIGEYIVGRDVPAGKYKLSTNMEMDPQFANLGWDLDIYNDNEGNSRSQNFNPGNQDVAIELKEGEIISTSFYNSKHDVPTDTAKLILTAV